MPVSFHPTGRNRVAWESRSPGVVASECLGRGAERAAARPAPRETTQALQAWSGVDVLVHLAGVRVRRGQGELHAGVDLRLHVALDAVEHLLVDEPLPEQAPGQRQQR